MTQKLLLFTCALLFTFSIGAQNLYVRKANNTQEMYALSTVKKVTFQNRELVVQTTSNIIRTPFANLRFVAYKDYGNIGIEETVSDQYIQLYPNPVNSVLELKVENYQNLHYQLFDLNGRLLLQNELHTEITPINVSHLQPATYLLSVNNGNNTVKTFKFVKQ